MTDIRGLVRRLDVEQKIGQIQGIVPMDLVDSKKVRGDESGSRPDEEFLGIPYELNRLLEARPNGVGHLSLGWQMSGDILTLRQEIARFQAVAREVNPFGIATLVHAEGINGLVHPGGHQFTTPWGQAATWDPSVSRTVGDIAAQQARWLGIHLYFSPVLDIVRDIRWGRVHETYGEDPELASRFGVEFIRGVQGDDGLSGILATGKHFLGYGHSLGGLNQAVTQLGKRELVDVYAEPFRRAIAEAGLSLVMNSYSEIDGIPAAENKWLLTDFLRGDLGFTGMVVSDYGSINMLQNTFRTAPDEGHAAARALAAGLDVELPSNANTSHLRPLLEDGTLSEEILDRAVERVLKIKARLGLVPELRSSRPTPEAVAPDEKVALDLAREMAASSITLLANDGTLPLTPGALKIAVVGPAADEVRIHFGAYSSVADAEMSQVVNRIAVGAVPAPDVFPELFMARIKGIEDGFENDARALHPDALSVMEAIRAIDPQATYYPFGSTTADELDSSALIDAVDSADVVVAVVGERTGWIGNNTAGEGRTSANPALPGNQQELIVALHSAGKRVVTVVVSGRPLLLAPVHDASAVVLLAPLLGQAGGSTIADTLFGKNEPTGRTPSTFPRHGGQIPLYHGHSIGSGYGHGDLPRGNYTDLADNSPLYPFGHGLGYTTFEMDLDEARVEGSTIHARASVRNSGSRPGTAVVQLYARDEAASVVRPIRQLLDFARLRIAPGETAAVDFVIPIHRLAYTWPDGRRGVESGTVALLLGRSSSDIAKETRVVVPEVLAPVAVEPPSRITIRQGSPE